MIFVIFERTISLAQVTKTLNKLETYQRNMIFLE